MRQLTSAEFQSFVEAKPAAAIHFDAEWDVAYGPLLRQEMLEAEKEPGDRADFGEADADRDMELARSVRLLNVPAVGYYRDGQLVALLTGCRQNVRRRWERVMREEAIGDKDGDDEGPGKRDCRQLAHYRGGRLA
jgi:thioredoxin-like negative regulator of GroEL